MTSGTVIKPNLSSVNNLWNSLSSGNKKTTTKRVTTTRRTTTRATTKQPTAPASDERDAASKACSGNRGKSYTKCVKKFKKKAAKKSKKGKKNKKAKNKALFDDLEMTKKEKKQFKKQQTEDESSDRTNAFDTVETHEDENSMFAGWDSV